MKYLDDPRLLHLSEALSANPGPEARVNVRFEAYSIKQIAKERKMFNRMEEAYASGQEEMDEMSFSPEMKEAGLSSVFGRLDVKESRKVHFLLVSTLNAAFPDHDFTALRPDHFTREISSADVLSHLTATLLGAPTIDLGPIAGSSPASHSPGFAGPSSLPNAAPLSSSTQALSRVLNDVVDLDECEVYSWLPEPEYDPHVGPEEDEDASTIEEDDEYEAIEGMDIDSEVPGWGGQGMDLDDYEPARGTKDDPIDLRQEVPESAPVDFDYKPRKVGGLLWSANYFFYSRRQKRVLFLTTWCRKRPSHSSPVDYAEPGSLPLPISSALSPPSGTHGLPSAPRLRATRHQNLTNLRPSQRKKGRVSGGGLPSPIDRLTSTIPIRSLATPAPVTHQPLRLASSAPTPTAFSHVQPKISHVDAMAKMTAGGFKPRLPGQNKVPAKSLLSAAVKSAARDSEADSRVRKERSETPGSQTGGGAAPLGSALAESSKRVKV
ncbi:hypothetical protein Q5752_002609 [Cryptotrichosporon argae]